MKVIDLLNKIANGEEVPKKIKRMEAIFTLEDDIDYINEDKKFLMGDIICTNKDDLNSEIKIIEEQPKKEGFVSNNHRFVPNKDGVSIFPVEEYDFTKDPHVYAEEEIEEDKEIEEINFITEHDSFSTIDQYKLQDTINKLIKAVNELKKGK